MNRRQLANELIRRQVARESLDDFANYMSTSQHLDFMHAPVKHQRIITRAIDQLLTPVDDPNHPKDRWGEPVTRLLLTAPPGSAKSTYCSVQAPSYILMKHPSWHLLCSSNTDDLAENFNRRRRSACATEEWQRLAETSLDPEAKGVSRFYTRKGGSVAAAGVGSAIVGVRSNINILDDPIKSWEQAQSETQLAKIWDWYEGEYRNRLVPDGREIVMHQRWSRNDPAGVLLRLIKSGEERGWLVINLPLVAPEAPEELDPLGRKPGECLWPKWYTERQLTEWKRDPAKWAALYQQHPLDEEGAWAGMEHINLIQPHEWVELRKNHQYRFMGAGDLALSTNKGDWTVFSMCAVTPDRDLVICEMVRKQQSVEKSVEDLYRLHQEYGPIDWSFDNDNATKVFERLVYEYARTHGLSPPPLDLMPMRGKDKEIRAAAIRGYFRSGRVSIVNNPQWAPDLIRAILRFPGEPDDEVDALGLIGRKMVQMSGIQDITPHKAQPIEGVIVERDGQQFLNLGLDLLFEQREREMRTRRWNRM